MPGVKHNQALDRSHKDSEQKSAVRVPKALHTERPRRSGAQAL